MARLILRLEALPGAAEPAAAQPAATQSSAAAEPDAAASPAAAAEPERKRATERERVVAEQFAAEAAGRATPRPETRVTRRYVDVAAPERMNVATPLTRWSAAVASAHDACFVIDVNGVLISISAAAVDLIGCGHVTVIGRHILDVLKLVDLESGAPDPEYSPRITPLAVLEQPGLSRSLVRVRHPDGPFVTLDCSSASLHDVTGYPLGSVTFLAPIRSIVK